MSKLKFSRAILNELNTGVISPLDLFESEQHLILINIKVECPKCGHRWAIKTDEFDNLAHIPKRRFICTECLGKELESNNAN